MRSRSRIGCLKTLSAIPDTPVSPQDAGVVVSGTGPSQRFPRQARVRAKAEFARVFDAGVRRAEPALALHWLADAAAPRLGLAVSRKVDPRAVGRNRIKRRLREAFRRLRPQLAPGAYVVVARAPAAKLDNAAIAATLQRLLARIGALPPSPPAGTMRAANPPSPPATPDPASG